VLLEKDNPMLLSPEIRFQSISVNDLQSLAEDLQRALPHSTISPINQRGKPVVWRVGDVAAIQLKNDDRKKPFMVLSLKEATIAPQQSDVDTLAKVLAVLPNRLDLQQDEEAGSGLVLSTAFLTTLYFFMMEKTASYNMGMMSFLAGGVVVLIVGLVMFGLRGRNAPEKGVSKLSLVLILPGFLMTAPLSLLNLPLMNYLRRFQGSRLLAQLG
jgi:hypothetical protein